MPPEATPYGFRPEMIEQQTPIEQKIAALRKQYVQTLDTRFAQLEQAYMQMIAATTVQDHVRRLMILSHTLCGSAGMFGFGDIATCCRRIEGLCHLLLRDNTNPKIWHEVSACMTQLQEAVLEPRLVEPSGLADIAGLQALLPQQRF
ncbi:MAG: Hpt domain-containing protein [Gammaproteobacteria bacterium]